MAGHEPSYLRVKSSCLQVYLTTSQGWEYDQLSVFKKIVCNIKKKFFNFNFVMNRFMYLVHTKRGGSDVWNSHWKLFRSSLFFTSIKNCGCLPQTFDIPSNIYSIPKSSQILWRIKCCKASRDGILLLKSSLPHYKIPLLLPVFSVKSLKFCFKFPF